MLPEQQQRIMGYFIEEAKDHLKTIEQGLLNLQSTIADPEAVSEVFRAAHSVKGGAAMLGLTSIQQTAHRLEDYFKVLKECPVDVDQRLETLFLRVYDTLQELVDQLQGPFGLTSDKAQEAMVAVEPIFTELGQHLNLLVSQSGGALPEDVELMPAASQVAAQPKVTRPAQPAAPVAARPAIAREESALQLIFQSDVPAQLREMLQLFKQTDTSETRQQLQTVCYNLSRPGEQLALPNWCELLNTVAKAIGNPDTTYRVLAPIVIKDIKNAQELVLSGRSTEITACENLLGLVPLEIAPPEIVLPESEAAPPEIVLPESEAAPLDNVTDADLADLLTTLDTAEVDAVDSQGLEDELSIAATSEESDINDWFNTAQTDAPISFSGFFDDEGSSELDVSSDLDFSSSFELASSDRSDDSSLDFDLGFGEADLNLAGDRLPDLSLSNEPSLSDELGLSNEPSLSDELGLSDEFSLSDELGLSNELDAPALENNDQSGPEVGIAELNSLADLFEGEMPDLGMTWQEEEMIQPEIGILPDLYAIAPSNDFEDLLFNQDHSEGLALDEDEDLSGLLNASTLDDLSAASPQFTHSSVSESEPDLLDLSDESESISFDLDDFDALDLSASNPIDSTAQSAEAAIDDFDASLFDNTEFDNADRFGAAAPRSESGFGNLDELLAGLDTDNLWDDIAEVDIASANDANDTAASDRSMEMDFNLAASPESEAINQADIFSLGLESPDPEPQPETELIDLDAAFALPTADEGLPEAPSEAEFDLSSLMGDEFSLLLGDDSDLALDQPLPEGLFFTETEAIDELNFGVDQVANVSEFDFNPFAAAQLQELGETATFDEVEESLPFSPPVEEPPVEEATPLDHSAIDGFADLDALTENNHSAANFADLDAFDQLGDLWGETPAENITANTEVAHDFAAHDVVHDVTDHTTDHVTDHNPADDFADLEAFLGEEEAIADYPIAPVSNLVEDDDFADLEDLLKNEMPDAIAPALTSSIIGARGDRFIEEQVPEEQYADDFADLDALLDEPPTSVVSFPAVLEDEFGDLEDLLKDADQKLGGTPAARGNRPASSTANRRPQRRSNLTDQTMRVSVKHLDNLNNLVGEIVVNRNSLEQAQERLRQFLDNLLYQVQQLSDVGQRMRDLYERSLLESSLISSRRSYQLSPSNGGSNSNFGAAQPTHATGMSFDALEMDRFTGFHTLSQEMIELIVRVRESASDIDFVVDESDQVTRNFRQITTQLQEGLTRSRMVHFAQTADRLPRGVRDNALKYGRQAELLIEGRDTLIDKMIVEQLYDPMTHLVNNAVAHGIETPAVRVAAGKPPTGKVTIRAFHHGNQTVISVSDDGAGIDPERVKEKAISKKLITAAEAKEMSRLDVYDLLFHHGFSTADQVDDLRGRGIGLDVVRSNLNEIRGVITIDSVIGKGTTFSIRLPLTLSISKALCCISNRARIAFPMDGVEDMLDVPKERIQIDEHGNSVISWRDTLLPFQPLPELLALNRVLGRGSVYGGNQEDDIASIVVLRSAGNFLALQVDQVLGEQEIVIKQLEGPVPKPIGIAGATVLGDGRIMPIADVLELIDLSQGRIRRESGNSLWEKGATLPEKLEMKSEPTVLIIDDSITVRELLSMTFNKVGYRVEQARDGQEAWEKLRSGLPCDLVFCDIEMPRMDGLELLSRIQKDPQLVNIPIAMLTSRGADRHRQMAVQLGAKGYFTKPYLEEMLLDAAQRMLKGEVLVS